MTAPSVTQLPDPPSPFSTPSQFSADAFIFVAALSGWTGDINNLVAWLNANIDAREVVNETGTAFDLNAQNSGAYVRTTNGSAKTLTVQPESVTAQPEGASYFIANRGAGDLTIVAGSGVLINGNVALTENATAIIQKIDTDTYDLITIGGDFVTDLTVLQADVATLQSQMTTRIQSVATIADLKTKLGQYNGQKIALLSYHDGWAASAVGVPQGDGIFVWNAASTASEEPGFIVAVTGEPIGRWYRILPSVLSPELCGAIGDGITNDRAAWDSLIAKVVQLGGGAIICRSDAEYLIWDGSETPASFEHIFALGAIKRFDLDLNGSSIVLNNTIEQGAFVLFGAQDGRNIKIRNGAVNALVGKFATFLGDSYGPIIFQGLDRCVGVSISDLTGGGWVTCVDFALSDPGTYLAYSQQAQQIEIYNIEATDISYGINCRFNGSYLKAWNLRFTKVHRGYFAYGVTDHEVEMVVLSWDACAARLWGVLGQTLQNIRLRVTGSAIEGPFSTDGVQLVWNGTEPALLNNIDVHVDINCNSIVNHGVCLVSEDIASSGRHKLDTFRLSGSVRSCVGRAFTPVNRGGDYTTHDISNCTYENFTGVEQGSNSVFPIYNTATQTVFRNVECIGTGPSILIEAAETVDGAILIDNCRSPQVVGNTNALFSAAATYRDCYSGNTSAAAVALENKIIENSIFGFLSPTVPVNRSNLKNLVLSPEIYSQPVVGFKLVDSASSSASVAVTLTAGADFYPSRLNSNNAYVRSYRLKVACSQSSNRGQIVADLSMQISGGVLTAAILQNTQAMVEAGSVSAAHLSVAVVSGNLVVTMNSGGAAIYDVVTVVITE